jgi:hypothetical protein
MRAFLERIDDRRAGERIFDGDLDPASERATRRRHHGRFAQAMDLIELASRRYGWPLPDDPRSLEEDRLAYRRWARLRAAYRPGGRSR